MKIGFSFGRCLRDIVMGNVKPEDVLVIITQTNIENHGKLCDMVKAYLDRPGYLQGCDEAQCLAVAQKLWQGGLIHQPRSYGAYPRHIPEGYVWMDVVPTAQDLDPGVREAWDAYRMLLVMRGNAIPEGRSYL